MSDYGHTGICKCSFCDAINTWQTDIPNTVDDYVWAGFLGECKSCGTRGFQLVTKVTGPLYVAQQLAEDTNETRTAEGG